MSRSQAAGLFRHGVDATHASAAAKAKQPRRTPSASDVVAPAPVSNHAFGQVLGSGAPLDPAVRAEMETRFGESFADVRIHDDAQAHRSAEQLEAKAYTHGSDVAFSEGRYAPEAPEGKRLLAHELAHVVQQRRGGAAPELSSAAPHEAGAALAAAQVAAGSANVAVSGATGVGVAREVDDEKKNSSVADPLSSQGLPLGDAARVLTPGPGYWLRHEPNLGAMKPMELRDEANEINEWIFRQTQSSSEMDRLKLVRDRLAQAATQQLRDATAVPKPSRRRRGRKEAAAAASAAPRAPLAQRNATTRDPQALADNYNSIVNDLRRKDLTPQERSGLQLELDSIAPLVDDDLARRSALRHANVVDEALTPEDRFYGKDSPMIERMRRIDSIRPDQESPGLNYLMHGRERIPMTDDMLQAIRTQTMRGLRRTATEVGSANDQVMADYREFVDRTFDEHPVVGLISMIRSEENPLDWEDKLLPIVAASNMQAGSFKKRHGAAQDPWNAAPPNLEQMARDLESSMRLAENARSYLDYKTGLVLEGTAGAIRHLGRMKTAGQVAASIAFTPLGGALYAAGGSTAEQLMRMHYGQQDEFDFAAPVIDAVSSYVAGKVTGGLTGGLGKNAPLWMRAVAFAPADRLGAAAGTITHGTLDRVAGRSKQGFGDIMGNAASDLTDWRQAGINLFTVGLSHAARSSRRTPASRRQSAPIKPDTPEVKAAPISKPAIAPVQPEAAPAPVAKPPTAAGENTAAAPKARSVTRQPAANENESISFGDAAFNELTQAISNSPFGQRIAAAERAGPAPLREDTTHTREQVDALAHSQARRNPPPGRVPGAQIQHDTKTMDVTTKLPAGTLPLHPDVINENLRWLQSSANLPATELHVDPRGGGTQYYADVVPRGRAGDAGTPGNPRPSGLPKGPEDPYQTEHKFADAHLIKEHAKNIATARQNANLPPLDPRMLAISAGEMARWQTTGHSGTERSGSNVDLARNASQRTGPVSPEAAPSAISSPLFDYFLRRPRAND